MYDDRLHGWGSHLREYNQLMELGAIRSAPDAAGLAALLRVPPDALARTLHDVAEMAAGRMPDPFGRDFTKHAPLAAPYRAVRVKGALFHTQGGLEIDDQARVRRADGTLLPNLFAGWRGGAQHLGAWGVGLSAGGRAVHGGDAGAAGGPGGGRRGDAGGECGGLAGGQPTSSNGSSVVLFTRSMLNRLLTFLIGTAAISRL